MAQLSTIISSILRDMVFAQHQANMYAIALKDIYSKYGRLDCFALPAVALGEMDLCIQYGITDSSAEVEQYEINFPALRDIEKGISKSCAKLLLDSAIPIFNEDCFSTVPSPYSMKSYQTGQQKIPLLCKLWRTTRRQNVILVLS